MNKSSAGVFFLLILLFYGLSRPGPVLAKKGLDCEAVNDTRLVVYLVRHAEKEAEPAADPPLTARGRARAEALSQLIPLAELVGVYSTPLRRTRDTVGPAAAAAGLEITEYPAADSAVLVAGLRVHRGGAVLVVGHSNTLPEILCLLGIATSIEIGDDEYGDLFIITLRDRDKPFLQRARFGDDPASGGRIDFSPMIRGRGKIG